MANLGSAYAPASGSTNTITSVAPVRTSTISRTTLTFVLPLGHQPSGSTTPTYGQLWPRGNTK